MIKNQTLLCHVLPERPGSGFTGRYLSPGRFWTLTYHLGTVMGLKATDRVLDIASGRGVSALHLAKHFNCHITGLDFGFENISAAQELAAAQGVSHLTVFRQGDAEKLPFDDNSFDAVISECSFCTFPDKKMAAEEMARVLRPDGRLGITDITVDGTLPDDVQTLLSWVACVAGTFSPEEYASILRKAGFTDFTIEDQQDTLLEMVNSVRRKTMGIELAIGLGKLDLGGLDLNSGKQMARRVVELIEAGILGYTLIVARKT